MGVIGNVLRAIHGSGQLTVNYTDAFFPRRCREQIYHLLSEMSSEAITSAHAPLHCQARTCVSRRDHVDS